jgi:hypothetical protein
MLQAECTAVRAPHATASLCFNDKKAAQRDGTSGRQY